MLTVLLVGCAGGHTPAFDRLSALEDEAKLAFAVPAHLPASFALASPVARSSSGNADVAIDLHFVDSAGKAPRRVGVCTVSDPRRRDACIAPNARAPVHTRTLNGVTAYVYTMTPETVDQATLASFARALTLDWRSVSWLP